MKSSFAKTDKRHFKKKIRWVTYIILHILRDLNPKHILSKKPVLSTFKASRVHVLLQKPTSALVVCEQKPISPF